MRPISILNFLPTFLPVSWIVNLNNFVQNILLFLSFLFLLSPSLSLFLLFTFYIFNLSFFIYIWYTRTQVVMRHVRKILWHPTLTRSLPTHSICPLIRTQKNGSKLLKTVFITVIEKHAQGKIPAKLPEKSLFQNLRLRASWNDRRLQRLSTPHHAVILSRN